MTFVNPYSHSYIQNHNNKYSKNKSKKEKKIYSKNQKQDQSVKIPKIKKSENLAHRKYNNSQYQWQLQKTTKPIRFIHRSQKNE